MIRRTRFELKKAEERAHILKGLMIAVDNIDEVIQIIRSSSTAEDARQKLADRFELDEIQTRAIVEMRLRQLTGLEMDKLRITTPLGCEEQHVVVVCGRIYVFYEIRIPLVASFCSNAASMLCSEFRERCALDISEMRDGYDHLVIRVEVFGIEVS